ncbi:hypothetical protein P3X46_028787 [Hevea brasiliensis]|uniref:Uncharacterized protein n=1 Tax=Hevea brasiliensis TaxID=3981 RepID=A0ABQ9KTK6_HEVBR|nr:uncharacterized protein At4g00950 isoform X2 [Hevea brasiliensis]KAJ9146537.1 hypothetical protein P3X46_028787 [Hevea brasiliensis]
MGSEASPTPRLPLFSLRSKSNEPQGLPTPPIHTLASVPFQWEEAPGKPRPCTTTNEQQPKSKTARCLELPPRLLCEAKVNNLPSPTTILDGPYLGHSRSRSRSLSFGKGMSSFSSLENLGRRGNKGRMIFGSSRWGSFRRNKEVVEGSVDFSSSPVFDSGDGGLSTKVKITRIRRKSSFLSFSSTRSHLWTNIYESFKQVVPWRRRQQRN